MFADTDLHLCILSHDPTAEGPNQHTVYHSVSCCKLQLSEFIKISVFYCHVSSQGKTISVLLVTLYVENDSESDQFEFCRSTSRNEHDLL